MKTFEKNLKMNQSESNSVLQSFAADGLDYILEIYDSEKVKQIAELEESLGHSDSELEEDISFTTVGKKTLLTHTESDGDLAHPGTSRDSDTNNYERNSRYRNVKDVATVSDSDSDNNESVHNIGDRGKNNILNEFNDEEQNALISQNINGSGSVEVTNVVNINDEDTNSECVQKAKKGKGKGKCVRFKKEDDNNPHELSKKNCKKPTKKMKTSESKCQRDLNVGSQDNTRTNLCSEYIDQSDKNVRIKEENDSNNVESNMGSSHVKDSVMEGERSGFGEAMYGRARHCSGNIAQMTERSSETNVPSAQSAQQSCFDEQAQHLLVRLKRQVKGCLNRLAESPLSSVILEMENLYRSNSFKDINNAFTAVLLESLVTPILSLERLIMEHVALVAYLHSSVGSDVGTYFLQQVMKQFDTLFNGMSELENKELDNVALIICYLYSVKIVRASLLFGILECLISRFAPKDLEVILVMLPVVGFGLWKGYSTRVKKLIVDLHEFAAANVEQCDESRVKVLQELLVTVEHNNMSGLPGWDPGSLSNMQTLLHSVFINRNVLPDSNIPLQDVLPADEGHWWVVGSGCSGQPPSEKELEVIRMNLEWCLHVWAIVFHIRRKINRRRNIFVTMATAQNYIDACNKLIDLRLNHMEARDIIIVIVECFLLEKMFSLFYARLLQALCERDRRFWMTLQCNLWKKFEEIKNMADSQFNNLVKLVQYLLVQNVITLGVFKVINLTEIEQPTVRFVHQVLLGILSGDIEEYKRVFHWVAKSPKHKIFGCKLNVFLHQYVLGKMSSDDPQRALLQERIDEVFTFDDL